MSVQPWTTVRKNIPCLYARSIGLDWCAAVNTFFTKEKRKQKCLSASSQDPGKSLHDIWLHLLMGSSHGSFKMIFDG